MLVPQGMAYALLAELPPQVGLYASMLPLLVYGLLGTSRALSVGPVAIVSLLTASGIAALAPATTAEALAYALTLALLIGILQIGLGALRLGFVVNFLSHPVLTGFITAAAIVIGFSQLKYVLGFDVPRGEFLEMVEATVSGLGATNPIAVAVGGSGILILVLFKRWLGGWLRRLGVPAGVITPLTRSGPLVIVVLGIVAVRLGLDAGQGVSVVGSVPAGLPPLTVPLFSWTVWRALLPTALAITFVSYMESISVAKSLAARRRENVDPNQELIALGAANVAAGFTGGYPVTGGFSRSLVNAEAGARTGLASIVTALLVGLSVLFLTPLFADIPKAMLGAIILVAVAGMVDGRKIRHVWRYSKHDAAAMLATFGAVLIFGIEAGILVGAGVSLLLMLWRSSNPHVAVVGRLGDTETYRNVKRHAVQTWPHVALVRIDASLYFGNSQLVEDVVLSLSAEQPALEHFILICSAVNEIDYTALELLEKLRAELAGHGVALHLAAVKGPVRDRLSQVGFCATLGEERIHLTTHAALESLGLV